MQWDLSDESTIEGAVFEDSLRSKACLLGCEQLRRLPYITTVNSIKSMQLIGCASLVTISNFHIATLTSLQSLYLIGCPALTSLPDGLSALPSLQMVCLVGLRSLPALPQGFEGQLEMHTLDLGWANVGTAGLGEGQLSSGMEGPSLRWCCYLTKPAEGGQGPG